MRLLRLTTREDTANFESSYQADITLPPKSKIGLQSVSINTLPTMLILTGFNNGIQYQIADGYSRSMNLTQRTYEASQIEQLLLDIEDRLNDSITYEFGTTTTNKPLGLEWNVELEDKKVVIQYKIGRSNSWLSTTNGWDLIGVTATLAGAGDSYYMGMVGTDPSSTTFTNVAEFNYPLSRGCGFARCRTRRLESGNTKNGYILGVVEDKDDMDDLDLSKVKYGIRVDIDNGTGQRFYRPIVDGVEGAITNFEAGYAQDSNNNEYQEIFINGNNIEIARYYDDAGNYQMEELDSAPYDGGDYYPFIAFFGTRATTQVNGIRITPSPFGSQPENPTALGEEVNAPPKPVDPTVGNQNNFFFFESLELAEYLGYTRQRQPASGEIEAYTISYPATNSYFIPQDADACLVQLMNLQIESYDSFSTTQLPSGGQRKNILSVIPSTSTTGKIVYEPSYPTFLDLNNEQPIILRNLHIRVVREDYTPIAIDGLGTIVILIE